MAKKGQLLAYRPTLKVINRRNEMYGQIDTMFQVHNRIYHQFNGPDGDRTLVQYIDDSNRRLNGNTPTREEQGKEDWQTNLFTPVTRTKLKALVAGVALQIPDIVFMAWNQEGLFSPRHSEFMKQMVRYSRLTKGGNPRLDIFFEAWELFGNGTVIKYDGYLKQKHKRKFVTGFDQTTGEVHWKEKEVLIEDRAVDVNVPLSEFLIWDAEIPDVQDQPRVAWIQHYNRSALELEFSNYKNYQFVKDRNSAAKFRTTTQTYYYDNWAKRVELDDDFEVIRIYDQEKDLYEIWINGVDILFSAPLLWGKRKKFYPFSKTINEPFSGKAFFYGMSLPHALEGNQDMNNVVWNTTLDKALRSLTPPFLVGLANKDLLDLEDEYINQDNKIYVPDINQVKPMPYQGLNGGDIQLIQIMSRALDLQSSDSVQSGVTGRGVTAREIEAADQAAAKLKGIPFMFLEDLWIQKTRLRVMNIMTNYMLPRMEAIIGKDGVQSFQEQTTIHNVHDVTHSDGTQGILGIQIVKDPKNAPSVLDIEAREEAMMKQGINYKMIAVPSTFLDDWEIDFEVVSDSVYSQDKVKKEALVTEKQDRIATYYPDYFIQNKKKLFGEVVSLYGENPKDYQDPPPPAPPAPTQGNTPLDIGAALAAGGHPTPPLIPAVPAH